jgi:CubicO group peptidase (beta-lactamase class C family)
MTRKADFGAAVREDPTGQVKGKAVTAPLPAHEELQRRLDSLVVEYGVPGAVVGLLRGGEQLVTASGVTRLGGGRAVADDTVFLIASITKVWTATLVMQLVDEGLVRLDAPIAEHLNPRLELADSAVAQTVTVQQLLSHTGGFFGDAVELDLWDDDAVELNVAAYHDLVQLHRPGTLFSYSNSGYVVLGRLVECVTGMTWDEALRVRLTDPLGLASTSTLPTETMTHPLAVGHQVAMPGSPGLIPVTRWLDPRSSGPCGGTLATTASDLLAFAQLHLRDGISPTGAQLLSTASAQAMREPQIDQPDPSTSPAWGLGWAIENLEPRVVGHLGSTCGQQSRLLVIPPHNLAICVIANGDIQGMGDRLVNELLRELTGISLPATPSPSDGGFDPATYAGRYWISDDATVDVREARGGLEASFTTTGAWAAFHGDFTTRMIYAGGTTFLMDMPPLEKPVTATFLHENGPEGKATHLACQLRVAPRIPTESTPS